MIYQSLRSLYSMPGAPEKIFQVNPEMKFIFAYCDPFARMLLHMQHAWKVGQKWPKKTKINHFETFEFAQVSFQINVSCLESVIHLKKKRNLELCIDFD